MNATTTRSRRRVAPVALALLAVSALILAPDASASAPASAPRALVAPHAVVAAVSRGYTAHPSGVAPPSTTPRGWVKVWGDDFVRRTVTRAWDKYSGSPGGYSNGRWSPSHVQSHNGMLILAGYRENGVFVTGGASATRASTLRYGKYLVRMRADKGVGVGYVALLWPSSGWPPEVDFAEDGGHDRSTTSGTAHFGSANQQVQRILRRDFSKWHTVGVEWTPTSLKYTIDGKVWATMRGAAVPHQPMHLAIQSAALRCTSWSACVSSATPSHVNIYVDWVVVYRRA